mmetsp:Transcript_30120/g.96890  ORF Transcript_30120/g.96890 Transcript_30120/m.96890 type:complete len:93 (-) Transcript_30120:594-872(-)
MHEPWREYLSCVVYQVVTSGLMILRVEVAMMHYHPTNVCVSIEGKDILMFLKTKELNQQALHVNGQSVSSPKVPLPEVCKARSYFRTFHATQ